MTANGILCDKLSHEWSTRYCLQKQELLATEVISNTDRLQRMPVWHGRKPNTLKRDWRHTHNIMSQVRAKG